VRRVESCMNGEQIWEARLQSAVAGVAQALSEPEPELRRNSSSTHPVEPSRVSATADGGTVITSHVPVHNLRAVAAPTAEQTVAQYRTCGCDRAVGKELESEREYREGIEAALAAEVSYRDKLKTSLASQLQEEVAARKWAESQLQAAHNQVRDERTRRLAVREVWHAFSACPSQLVPLYIVRAEHQTVCTSQSEEELRRSLAENDSLRERVDGLHAARDGACADLASEKQLRQRATSELARASDYSRELEALVRP
jgi:hypothetical protein